MKLFFAAPLRRLPSDPTALGAHASRLHFARKAVRAAPASSRPFFRSPCSRTFPALAPPLNRGQTPLTKPPASAVSSLLSILEHSRRRRFCGSETTGFAVIT